MADLQYTGTRHITIPSNKFIKSLSQHNPNSNWHLRTVTMLDVLNSLMQKRLIVKSSDCTHLLSNAHISKAYSIIGISASLLR